MLDIWLNFFKLTSVDSIGAQPKSHFLSTHFSVFILGSQVALAFFLIERSPILIGLVQWRFVRILLDLASLAIALSGLKRHMHILGWYQPDWAYKVNATLYWSGALLLTMLNHPNLISNFFDNFFLKSLGKYYLSCYLLHFGSIYIVKHYFFKMANQVEHIIVCIGLSYFVGCVFYHVIEDPLIRFSYFLCAKVDKVSSYLCNSSLRFRDNDSEHMLIDRENLILDSDTIY
jgi:peptidoglycan/LPS O-acetylase OafA/YrhL